MSTQISLNLSNKMFEAAKKYTETKGFENLQHLIRETLRQKLFEGENVGGIYTSKASEKSLSKNWSSKKEDKAWQHFQKKT
jgi:hypothetical protein